jgi:hypothetical protein
MSAAEEKVDGQESPSIHQDGATTNNSGGKSGHFATALVEAPESTRSETNGPAPGRVNPADPEASAKSEGQT